GGQYQQQPFRRSQPDGIVAAGPDFLNRVFELETDEVAAIDNHDQSITYVVRLVEHQYSPEELHNAFLADANTWPGLQLMIRTRAQMAEQLLVADVLASADVSWERPADEIDQDEAG